MDANEIVVHREQHTECAWFSTFFEKALVSRVNRRVCIRTLRFDRSAYNVLCANRCRSEIHQSAPVWVPINSVPLDFATRIASSTFAEIFGRRGCLLHGPIRSRHDPPSAQDCYAIVAVIANSLQGRFVAGTDRISPNLALPPK